MSKYILVGFAASCTALLIKLTGVAALPWWAVCLPVAAPVVVYAAMIFVFCKWGNVG